MNATDHPSLDLDSLPVDRDAMLKERQRLLDLSLGPNPTISAEQRRQLEIICYGLDIHALRDHRESELLHANNALLARARQAEAAAGALARATITPEMADAVHGAICDRVFLAMCIGNAEKTRSSGVTLLAHYLSSIAIKRDENNQPSSGGSKTISVLPSDVQIAAAFILENAPPTTAAIAAAPNPRRPGELVAVAVVPVRASKEGR